MARIRALVGTAATSLLVVACNLLTGVSSLEAVPDEAGITVSDSGVDGGAVDASNGTDVSDAKPPIDTGPPPTCPSAGHSCVPAPPAGWDGPFMIYVGEESKVPECPTEMPAADDAPTGAFTGAFSCECRCGGVIGAKCTAFLDEFNGPSCADPQVGREDLSTCRMPDAEASFRASLDLVNKGGCSAVAAFKTKEDPAFAELMRICHRETSFAADGCTAAELCVPDGVAPFKTHACIGSADPAATCPAPFTERHRIYSDVSDTRACNAGTCACDEPAGTTCTGRMRNYTASTACAGTSTPFDLPVTACIAVTVGTSQRVVGTPNAVGGSCAASGNPAPTGSVEGTGGATICCLP